MSCHDLVHIKKVRWSKSGFFIAKPVAVAVLPSGARLERPWFSANDTTQENDRARKAFQVRQPDFLHI